MSPFAKGVAGHDAAGETWAPVGANLDALLLAEFVAAIREGRAAQTDGAVEVRTVEIVTAALASAAQDGAVVPSP